MHRIAIIGKTDNSIKIGGKKVELEREVAKEKF